MRVVAAEFERAPLHALADTGAVLSLVRPMSWSLVGRAASLTRIAASRRAGMGQ